MKKINHLSALYILHMRTCAYFFTVLFLALGIVWASAYVSFLGAFIVFAFFQNEQISNVFYIVSVLGSFFLVGYQTSIIFIKTWRTGVHPNFRGWRYLGTTGCVIVIGLLLLAFIGNEKNTFTALITPPSLAGILYLTFSVFFAIVALPSSSTAIS